LIGSLDNDLSEREVRDSFDPEFARRGREENLEDDRKTEGTK